MNTYQRIQIKNSKQKFIQMGKILLVGMIISILSISCKGPPSSQTGGDLGDALAARGLLNVEEITVSEDQVIITYVVLLEEDPEVMVTGWLMAMDAAAAEAPEAHEIVLQTTFSGEPYLTITGKTEDIQSLSAGELDQESFFENLEIVDNRPLENRIFGDLIKKGLDVADVSQSDGRLVIEYYPSPAESKTDLMEEWLEIFISVIEMETNGDSVQIRALMPDTSVFVVETEMTDLAAYFEVELSAFEFLARMTIEEQSVPVE